MLEEWVDGRHRNGFDARIRGEQDGGPRNERRLTRVLVHRDDAVRPEAATRLTRDTVTWLVTSRLRRLDVRSDRQPCQAVVAQPFRAAKVR